MADTALNILELKNNNRNRILELLRYNPLSRAELSQKTGLAKSSVTTLTAEMISDGILCEAGLDKQNGLVGRRRILLDINGDYGYVFGINLHRKRIALSAVNIKGEELWSHSFETRNLNNQTAPLQIKKALLQKKAELTSGRLLGIGIAAPGPLDCEKGIILEPPNFKLFNNFNITDFLEKEFDCPVFLENDAATLATAEHCYIKKQNGSSLFVTISDGIGSALMKNGDIYGGSHGIAGELGHISIDPFGEKCPCGNRGCLEQYATLSALKARFDISGCLDLLDDEKTSDEGKKAFEFLVNTLGTALVGAVNLFDLDAVIIYGEYNPIAQRLSKALEDYIKAHSVICKVHPVMVMPSGQDRSKAAFAAAIPAINKFFSQSI